MLIAKDKCRLIVETKDMGCQAVDTKRKNENKGNSKRAAFSCVTLLSDASLIYRTDFEYNLLF